MIRPACEADLDMISSIYERIHDNEEAGLSSTGWIRGVYPVRATAEASLLKHELYVLCLNGNIVAAARINHEQEPSYDACSWLFPASTDQVLVLHTLVVDPKEARRGLGKAFVHYYEAMARQLGCTALRLDTNERNTAARHLYPSLGYREAGIVPCDFHGIPGIRLVLFEKRIS